MYPGVQITHDAKVLGRYSKNQRQIDVLIEDETAGFPLVVLVDAKYFSHNIEQTAGKFIHSKIHAPPLRE
jgi:hypothetical protein